MHDDDLIYSDLFHSHGLLGCFTKRTGGVSPGPFDSLNFGTGLGDSSAHIASNLQRLVQKTGLASRPHQAIQVHGASSLYCQGPGLMHDHNADALLTSHSDVPLAVRTADCLPVLLADPVAGVIAAVHAGWRGTVRNIVSAALAEMRRKGADPARMIASLGPAIGPCCFHIDTATAQTLSDCIAGAGACINRGRQISADLVAINRLQLLNSGIQADPIECIQTCTSCHPGQFFSFRRDGEMTGRQLAVVARPANP
ncbi:MAG: peptidoglycan editing factor PgeF [Mariprofundaceae bacterium]